MVIENDPHMIALCDLDGRGGRRAIKAPQIESLVRVNRLFQHLGDQVEHLGLSILRVGQITDVGSDDRIYGGAGGGTARSRRSFRWWCLRHGHLHLLGGQITRSK